MKYRKLGKTGFTKWGDPFSFENAEKILETALNAGVNFIDTADVYSEGKSEKAVGEFIHRHRDRIYLATKCGRQLNPHISEAYQPAILRKFVENSLKRMRLEVLDLIQLHCPPTEVYYRPEIFELFDKLKQEGKILNLGVSVEKVEEALKAIEYSNVTTIQIIFNIFRQRPAQLFFQEAEKRDIGIIVRVPLASGLLSGTYTNNTTFAKGDHRNFNRNGAAFDKGETFSGIDYETGLTAVEELKLKLPGNDNLAPLALRWILMHKQVSCIIPGASKPAQVNQNIEALALPDLTAIELNIIEEIYTKSIKPLVHHLW
jgi:aryl-alcohol dehydrogenase-like predicted oxidoreductase